MAYKFANNSSNWFLTLNYYKILKYHFGYLLMVAMLVKILFFQS